MFFSVLINGLPLGQDFPDERTMPDTVQFGRRVNEQINGSSLQKSMDFLEVLIPVEETSLGIHDNDKIQVAPSCVNSLRNRTEKNCLLDVQFFEKGCKLSLDRFNVLLTHCSNSQDKMFSKPSLCGLCEKSTPGLSGGALSVR